MNDPCLLVCTQHGSNLFPVVQRLKIRSKGALDQFLACQLDQLKRCQPVKVLPTKKGRGSQNETDTPTNFRGVTLYTPKETVSGRSVYEVRICAEIMYTCSCAFAVRQYCQRERENVGANYC